NAARSDPMIAGKDAGARMVEPRRMTALPGGEPMRQFLQPPERAGRFGELPLMQHRCRAGLEIGPRQMGHQRANFIEARRHFRHRVLLFAEFCTTPTKVGAHFSVVRAPARWVPAFPTDQVRGLEAHGMANARGPADVLPDPKPTM